MFTLVLGASGCWFSPGHEEFVCESDADCNREEGLVCKTFGYGGKSRSQCRKPGTHSIGSKSGYSVFAIYLSYTVWIGGPLFIAGSTLVRHLRTRGTAAPKQQS